MIRVENLHKRFGKHAVIHGISMTIPSSEICCLLGPSGSGKTTLLRLMIGAIAADQGSVQFEIGRASCRERV